MSGWARRLAAAAAGAWIWLAVSAPSGWAAVLTEKDVIEKVILEAQPTKRFVKPEEVAGIAAFLAGPDAVSITGAMISVDGGWSAGYGRDF